MQIHADTTLIEAARRIAPVIREHSEEAERERRLSPPVLAALHEAGLLRMCTPRSLGGLEVTHLPEPSSSRRFQGTTLRPAGPSPTPWTGRISAPACQMRGLRRSTAAAQTSCSQRNLHARCRRPRPRAGIALPGARRSLATVMTPTGLPRRQ